MSLKRTTCLQEVNTTKAELISNIYLSRLEVKLTDIVEIVWVNRIEANVKSVDNPGADTSNAAVGAMNDFDKRMLGRVLVEDGGGGVFGAIIHDDPEGGLNLLSDDAVEGIACEIRLIATCGDKAVTSRGGSAPRGSSRS